VGARQPQVAGNFHLLATAIPHAALGFLDQNSPDALPAMAFGNNQRHNPADWTRTMDCRHDVPVEHAHDLAISLSQQHRLTLLSEVLNPRFHTILLNAEFELADQRPHVSGVG
jgi:hypothetical protein